MGRIDNRIAEFTRNLAFFSSLPEPEARAVLEHATVRICPKDMPLFHQGDMATHFFIVVSGWIKLFRITPEGEEALTGLAARGDVFGEAVLAGDPCPASAQAAEESRVLCIPGDALRALAASNPNIAMHLLSFMAREIRKLQRHAEQMATMSAPRRVACLLLHLSSHLPGAGGVTAFPYDKSLAAARLGIKPETFSRALGQLRRCGVHVNGREIRIESFARLAAFSCGHCTALPGECRGSSLCAACPVRNERAIAC